MGRAWRRVSEAVRQTLGGANDKSFLVTSNARNEAMFREATEFSSHIRVMERDLLALEKQVTSQFSNLRDILITPLPKIYDRVEEDDHAVVPRGDPALTIGHNVNYDRLSDAMTVMKSRIEEEVFAPMQEWMKDFKRVNTEMKRLEALRLELDSRKRTVASLDKELSTQRDRNIRQGVRQGSMNGAVPEGTVLEQGPPVEDPKLHKLIEKTEQKKFKKDENLRINQEMFDHLEETVFKKLETLIIDAASLREYAASSLVHIQECFATAIAAFDVPAAPASGYVRPSESGAQPAEKRGDRSLLRAIASKLVNVRQPAPRDHDANHDQAPAAAVAFDAAPAGKMVPASALPPVDVDSGRTWTQQLSGPAYAVSPTHMPSSRW